MPIPFSVVCTTEVEAFVIQYDDLIRFPEDVKQLLMKNIRDRLDFLKKRVIEICWNLQKVNKWDGFHQYYEDKGEEIKKQFPIANKGALQSLRTKSIASDPSENRKGSLNWPTTART